MASYHLYIRLSIFLYIISLSICRSTRLSIYLSVYLFVYLSMPSVYTTSSCTPLMGADWLYVEYQSDARECYKSIETLGWADKSVKNKTEINYSRILISSKFLLKWHRTQSTLNILRVLCVSEHMRPQCKYMSAIDFRQDLKTNRWQ